jgi:hypothetical protein
MQEKHRAQSTEHRAQGTEEEAQGTEHKAQGKGQSDRSCRLRSETTKSRSAGSCRSC